jgi:hypothetical protein
LVKVVWGWYRRSGVGTGLGWYRRSGVGTGLGWYRRSGVGTGGLVGYRRSPRDADEQLRFVTISPQQHAVSVRK